MRARPRPLYARYTYGNPRRVHGLARVAIRVYLVAIVGRQRSRYGVTETSAQTNAVVDLHGIAIHFGHDLFDGRARTPRMLVRIQYDIMDLETRRTLRYVKINTTRIIRRV